MNFLVTQNSVSVFLLNKAFTIAKDDPRYNTVLDLIKNNDETSLLNLLQFKNNIVKNLSKTALDVKINSNGSIEVQGFILDGTLGARMKELIENELPIENVVNFIKKLQKNPSFTAKKELFDFIEHCNLPITSSGNFLAYKKIRSNYTDCHTGTISNAVGNTVEVPRNAVDDNRDNECSYGLHVCSKEYLKSFSGDRIVVCEVNPEDVVSFPRDYNFSKGRVCKYTVIAEITDTDIEINQDFSNYLELSNEIGDDTDDELEQFTDNTESSLKDRNTNIKVKYSSGMSITQLSKEFNLSRRQIGRILFE